MKYKVKEYASVTILHTCEVEADSPEKAIETAQDEGVWDRDNFYEAWGDEIEYEVEEI